MFIRPPKNWSHDPFSPVIRERRLYGAGSTDMKGGTTAMVMAGTVLAALDEPAGGQVVILAVPNHFEGGEGTRRALDQGLVAEAGIICEPTDLDICAAQRGICYLTIRIHGVAAHTVATDIGINAIEKAQAVIAALTAREFRRPGHDAYGDQKIVNIAMIEGGLRHNLIPEDCRLTVDIRFAPSMTMDAVLDEVRAILARTADRDPRVPCRGRA